MPVPTGEHLSGAVATLARRLIATFTRELDSIRWLDVQTHFTACGVNRGLTYRFREYCAGAEVEAQNGNQRQANMFKKIFGTPSTSTATNDHQLESATFNLMCRVTQVLQQSSLHTEKYSVISNGRDIA
jgi:hypothetical protein